MDQIPVFEAFGPRLRWWRERRGYGRGKQGEFAAKLGISQPSLSELEKGQSKQPSAEVLMRAAEVLALRPQYLLFGAGSPEVLSMHDLNGLEGQLVTIFKRLPSDALRDALLIDANHMLNSTAPTAAPSIANPFPNLKPGANKKVKA